MRYADLKAQLTARVAAAEAEEARQIRRAAWRYLAIVAAAAVLGLVIVAAPAAS